MWQLLSRPRKKERGRETKGGRRAERREEKRRTEIGIVSTAGERFTPLKLFYRLTKKDQNQIW